MAVDFAIFTPLPEEWRAVKSHLRDLEEPASTFPTAVGRIGRYRVVVRMPPETGGYAAADLIRQLAEEWSPRWMAVVGVAGGFAEKGIALGDVVVASKIYAYDVGKIHGAPIDTASSFERRDKSDVDVDRSWLSFAKLHAMAPTAERTAWTKNIRVTQRPDKGRRLQSRVHVGPTASGEKVVDDLGYQFFADARAQLPDLYAIEMEGAGAGTAIRNMQSERPIGLIMVRGISDLPRDAIDGIGESGGRVQRDSWKPYAAAAAAAFFEHLLSGPGTPPSPSEMANDLNASATQQQPSIGANHEFNERDVARELSFLPYEIESQIKLPWLKDSITAEELATAHFALGTISENELKSLVGALGLLPNAAPRTRPSSSEIQSALSTGRGILIAILESYPLLLEEHALQEETVKKLRSIGGRREVRLSNRVDYVSPEIVTIGETRIAFEAVLLPTRNRLLRDLARVKQELANGSVDVGFILTKSTSALPRPSEQDVTIVNVEELEPFSDEALGVFLEELRR